MSAQPRQREFRAAPSALGFMARAILAPRRRDRELLPPLAATWRGHRADGAVLDSFLALTGLRDHPHWALLYPHVVGFRLQMTLLTDHAFPFPIWGSLQIRNHLVLHRPWLRGAALEFATRVAGRRVLEKGTEIDLASTVLADGALAWEGTTTFYYRGRHGGADAPSPLAEAPAVNGEPLARWEAPARGGTRFGALTGDYNGIHLSRWYARLFGFRAAFLHSQRVLGQCLARLPRLAAGPPVRLDAWLKGPVFYGAEVALSAGASEGQTESGGQTTFALRVAGDPRPAIVGRVGPAAGGIAAQV